MIWVKIKGKVSTHSRLKAAGFWFVLISTNYRVSTHSRLKAAGLENNIDRIFYNVFQHTAA